MGEDLPVKLPSSVRIRTISKPLQWLLKLHSTTHRTRGAPMEPNPFRTWSATRTSSGTGMVRRNDCKGKHRQAESSNVKLLTQILNLDLRVGHLYKRGSSSGEIEREGCEG